MVQLSPSSGMTLGPRYPPGSCRRKALHTHAHTHVHTCVHTRTHTCTHAHTHAHTARARTHTHTPLNGIQSRHSPSCCTLVVLRRGLCPGHTHINSVSVWGWSQASDYHCHPRLSPRPDPGFSADMTLRGEGHRTSALHSLLISLNSLSVLFWVKRMLRPPSPTTAGKTKQALKRVHWGGLQDEALVLCLGGSRRWCDVFQGTEHSGHPVSAQPTGARRSCSVTVSR